MDLCAKYRPKSLDDIYGHQHVVNFFKSVLQRPEESPRYYLLQSGFGLGKCVAGTSLINTPSGVRTIRSFFPENIPDSETALKTNVPYSVEDGFGSTVQSTELYYSGMVPTVAVDTSFSSIYCTLHHPLYVWDSELGKFDWCRADRLIPERHYVMLSSVKSSELNGIDEYWWSLGVLFGAYWWATSTLSTVRGDNPDSTFGRCNSDGRLILHKDYVQAVIDNLGCSFIDVDFPMVGGFPKNHLPLSSTNLQLPAGIHFEDYNLSFLLTRSITEQVSFLAGYCANNLDISYSPTVVSRVCVQHFQLFQSIALSAGMAIRSYEFKGSGLFDYTAFHVVTEDVNSDLFSWFYRDQFICRFTVSGKGLKSHCPGLAGYLSKQFNRKRLSYKRYVSVRDLHNLDINPNVFGETYVGMIPSPVRSVVSGGIRECFDLVLPTERHSFVANGIVSHNTTLCRAFAHDLIGEDFMDTPNYLEIDSSEKAVVDNFDYFREMMFQEVPGWKVVTIDESHLLPIPVSQRLLKILEDFTGKLFLFFATTNPELMFPPLLSRVHKFSLPLFNADQVKDYLTQIATRESLTISDQGLAMLALNSQGHLRDALKSLELVALQGEETYLKSFSPVWVAIQDYFFGDTDPDKMVSSLSAFAPTQLRQYFTYFMRQHVLNPKAKNYGKVYPSHLLPKLFSTWLQLSSKIVSADDFFSLIYVFHPILTSLRSKNG